jgi:pimeloyl-ACP methyl ester carboxylesterase
VIRRGLALAAAALAAAASLRVVGRRGAERLLDAPRRLPGEAGLASALTALGGEIVRLRSRDGVRLAARWLPAEPTDEDWSPDPHEAVLLLHGYSGSIAPDLVEYGPFLRATAGVLGLDFRGHGESEDGPTTFGPLETEDVAGALAWLGERGIRRVALFGTSLGGIVAIAATVVLGDGSLPGAEADPAAPIAPAAPPRPAIVAIVADSAAPELVIPVASRLRGPARRFVAGRLFDAIARRLGSDPRETEPARVVGLIEPVPLLLIHGESDTTVPLADGRRLAALAGRSAEHWVVPAAEHSAGHATAPADYETRVTAFLRAAFAAAREERPIIAAPGPPAGDPNLPPPSAED